jgi:hypothetical protein
MSNVLSEEKKQQGYRVIALGKLGWPLRRVGQAAVSIERQ